MRKAVPTATLTYPIDGFFNPSWATRFADVPALAKAVDLVFLMCYDSTGLWGQPHPRANANSPLFGGAPDYGYDIDWQLNRSLAAGMPASQLVIGVPWYGREWPVFGAGTGERQREIRLTQPNLDPNVTAGEHTGLPLSVVEARNRSAQFGAIDASWAAWDDTTKTPYYNWVDHWGQWGLGTYEDARSLGAKYEYAKSRGVGIGIWAIDYPMGDEAEWQTLQLMQAKTDDDAITSSLRQAAAAGDSSSCMRSAGPTASNSVEYDTEDLASTGLKLSPNDIKRLNAYNSTDIPPAPAPAPS